jgi:hypothetical protein
MGSGAGTGGNTLEARRSAGKPCEGSGGCAHGQPGCAGTVDSMGRRAHPEKMPPGRWNGNERLIGPGPFVPPPPP